MPVVFAHHMLVASLPVLLPAVVLPLGLAVLTIRDRRRDRRAGHHDHHPEDLV